MNLGRFFSGHLFSFLSIQEQASFMVKPFQTLFHPILQCCLCPTTAGNEILCHWDMAYDFTFNQTKKIRMATILSQDDTFFMSVLQYIYGLWQAHFYSFCGAPDDELKFIKKRWDRHTEQVLSRCRTITQYFSHTGKKCIFPYIYFPIMTPHPPSFLTTIIPLITGLKAPYSRILPSFTSLFYVSII